MEGGGGVSSSFEAYSWHRSSSTTVQISWKRPYSHSAERGKFSKGRTGSIFSGHRVCISSVIGGMRFRIGGEGEGKGIEALVDASSLSKPPLETCPRCNPYFKRSTSLFLPSLPTTRLPFLLIYHYLFRFLFYFDKPWLCVHFFYFFFLNFISIN